MAPLEKIQFGIFTPEGPVKMASGKPFSVCEPRTALQECHWKNTVQLVSLIVIFQNTNASRAKPCHYLPLRWCWHDKSVPFASRGCFSSKPILPPWLCRHFLQSGNASG